MDYPRLTPAAARDGRTLPDRIAELFIARIFTGELGAGERLPPDRELAELLSVDRTSLRMAMAQLSRMGLVRAVRGSGVSVLDYREHAGLDFLAAVFALPGVSLGGAFLLQLLDDWIDLMPTVAGRALARATPEDRVALDAIVAQQLASLQAGAAPARLVDLEVELQDRIVKLLGNPSLLLLRNSSRPLRIALVRMYFEETDVRSHVEAQRALLRAAVGESPDPARTADVYRAYLRERTEGLRGRLRALPLNPSLVAPAPRPAAARPRAGRRAAPKATARSTPRATAPERKPASRPVARTR